MKEKVIDMMRSTAIGIGLSMVIFCLSGVVFDIGYGGHFSLDNYMFTKMVVGCIIIGIGFGAPTVVYRNENLPMPVRVIIHMGIGCAVYTPVAFAVGWMGGAASIGQGILSAIIHLGVAFGIWFLFMRYYRREAEKMNEKIQEMKIA